MLRRRLTSSKVSWRPQAPKVRSHSRSIETLMSLQLTTWKVSRKAARKCPTNFSLSLPFASSLLPKGGDKLKFVGHRSRNSGITFQVVYRGISRPQPVTTSTALQDHKILG